MVGHVTRGIPADESAERECARYITRVEAYLEIQIRITKARAAKAVEPGLAVDLGVGLGLGEAGEVGLVFGMHATTEVCTLFWLKGCRKDGAP